MAGAALSSRMSIGTVTIISTAYCMVSPPEKIATAISASQRRS